MGLYILTGENISGALEIKRNVFFQFNLHISKLRAVA
jgi:hypothetical protein